MAKRIRRTYTDEQKKNILAAALKERLTALQVKKKFGVTPVTYYSWRKKTGVSRRRGRLAVRVAAAGRGGDIVSVVRGQVQDRVRAMIPDIVRSEVNSYLDTLLGRGGIRRGRRKRL